MKRIREMTVAMRLGLTMCLLMLAMLANGGFALHSLATVAANGQSIYDDRIVPLSQLKHISDAYAVDVIDSVNKANAGLITAEQGRDSLAKARREVEATWGAYMATKLTPKEQQLAAEAQALFLRANATIDQATRQLGELKGNVAGQLVNLDGPLYESIDPISNKINELTELQVTVAKLDTELAFEVFKQASVILVAMIVAAVLLACAVAARVIRHLRRALGAEPGALRDVAMRVAAGDLQSGVAVGAGDERSVMASLATMQRELARIVGQVRLGSDSIATASAQIAQGNLDLSERTQEQASALQQTAATMEQLGSTIRVNTDNAHEASRLAHEAAKVAAQGGDVVKEVVATMHGITDSGRKIGEIIGVIDAIAFQTNILALNAAVEAARAGEQGRGFAVVASEVRGLSRRTAEAAREIQALITGNVEQVDQGAALVDQAGRTMAEVVLAIRQVSDLVSGISLAVAEQSRGVEQVGDAVGQMDGVTQRNAALVEESAAAADSLRHQAQQLVDVVSVFKVR